MPRQREGFIRERNGKVYACIQYTGEDGRRKEKMRRADNRTHAKQIIKNLLRELDEAGEQSLDNDRMTFRELAALYKKSRLIPAVYHGEGEGQRKIAGLRSYKPAQGYLVTLAQHFGAKRIRNITHDDIEQFKLRRLSDPTRSDMALYEGELRKNPEATLSSTRTIASVNRELELMRAIIRFAKRQGYLTRSPFEMGAPLISKADESRRERVLTHEEERRLLAACGAREVTYERNGKMIVATDANARRRHLRPLIIAALDTAMRRGELLKLRWHDVDFVGGVITITAMNSKTARARKVAMTPRLREELERLRAYAPDIPNGLVFGITDTIKQSFASACKAAGISGFRFHDCRHTAITRLVQAGISPMEVMKISGHTQHVTFARYVNPNAAAILRAADALAAYNAKAAVQEVRESELTEN
jgi:integrase